MIEPLLSVGWVLSKMCSLFHIYTLQSLVARYYLCG